MKRFLISIIAVLAVFLPAAAALEMQHHQIRIIVHPDLQEIEVSDTINCRAGAGPLCFLLNAALTLSIESPGYRLQKSSRVDKLDAIGINAYFPEITAAMPVNRYTIVADPPASGTFSLRVYYRGKIALPPTASRQEYQRSFQETPGIVCRQGIYLAAGSFWYPRASEKLLTFQIEAQAPAAWQIISQGRQRQNQVTGASRTTVWNCTTVNDEIYLVGGPLHVYQANKDQITTLVYLHGEDRVLADKYLQATGKYLQMYQQLIGPYPYCKFALVENFWESGYGMPSFTLLGPRIIRFPFIIYSSYPHEILHNWWGNGVFVAYRSGNWCEGLTAYLADHLLKEQRGQGQEYRRQVLQKYRDFVRSGNDFPLQQFRARHSPATEAVGYGKSLMLFHELRLHLGDKIFCQALREFYRRYRLRQASFADIEQVFIEISHQDLRRFFQERLIRSGAPQLRLRDCQRSPAGTNYLVNFTLEQSTPPYQLQIPVAITLAHQPRAFYTRVPMADARKQLALLLPAPPLRIDVDPEFDLFRKLERSEIPPAIGQIFGSPQQLFYISSQESQAMQRAYRQAAEKWLRGNSGKIVATAPTQLPQNHSLWLFGYHDKLAPLLQRWSQTYGVSITPSGVSLAGKTYEWGEHSLVITFPHPDNPECAIGWVNAASPQAMAGLQRKVPHYGKYSYLAFHGNEPTNLAKGQWPVLNSPLTHCFVANAGRASLPERQALAQLPERIDAGKLAHHVRFLAAPKLRGRELGSAEIDVAARYLADYFRQLGLKPGGDGNSYHQRWQQKTGRHQRLITLANIIALVPGTDPRLEKRPLVVGAHYDHLGTGWPDVKAGQAGKIHPGADDNASGVAVLLELARLFVKHPGKRPIIFVGFSGEEAGRLGSRHFLAALAPAARQNIMAMLNLDTVGRLGSGKLLALNCNSAREWSHIIHGCSYVTGVVATPVALSLDASDQVSFIEAGIPAVQLFTGAHVDYHSPGDTIAKIDVPGLAKVTRLAEEMVRYLSERREPLTPTSLRQGTPAHPQTEESQSQSGGYSRF